MPLWALAIEHRVRVRDARGSPEETANLAHNGSYPWWRRGGCGRAAQSKPH
jgi:hypothetical protein